MRDDDQDRWVCPGLVSLSLRAGQVVLKLVRIVEARNPAGGWTARSPRPRLSRW